MMGHTGLIELDKNYFKTHVLELVEEYLNAVPHLTISDEERTKAQNKALRTQLSEKQQLESKVEELQSKVDALIAQRYRNKMKCKIPKEELSKPIKNDSQKGN